MLDFHPFKLVTISPELPLVLIPLHPSTYEEMDSFDYLMSSSTFQLAEAQTTDNLCFTILQELGRKLNMSFENPNLTVKDLKEFIGKKENLLDKQIKKMKVIFNTRQLSDHETLASLASDKNLKSNQCSFHVVIG